MLVRFIGQPFDGQVGKSLQLRLRGRRPITMFRVATAWAQASGLMRVADVLRDAKRRGLRTEIVLGIDANGGSFEGLELARELFDDAWVFYDPGARTFHPKIYAGFGPNGGFAFVGSANLTKGGLYTNYEAATLVDVLHNDDTDGHRYLNDVAAYLDSLKYDSGPACQPLNDETIAALRNQPGLKVWTQRERNALAKRNRSPRPTDEGLLFGAPVQGLPHAPAVTASQAASLGLADPDGLEADDTDGSAEPLLAEDQSAAVPTELRPPDESATQGFYKRLAPFDVSTTAAPGQIIIPMRFLDFFPPLQDETAARTSGGSTQFACEFQATFRDGEFVETVTPRVILYGPSPSHPRTNREIRFTFRDRTILDRLQAGDYLEFTRGDTGQVQIARRAPDAFEQRFASLP